MENVAHDAGGSIRNCIRSWTFDLGNWLVEESFCSQVKKSCWYISSHVWQRGGGYRNGEKQLDSGYS